VEFGIIGNCKTSALVGSKGEIIWMPYPDIDSPSIFTKLLDPNAGSLEILPDKPCKFTQEYIENTNILETVAECKEYAFRIIDFFPRYKKLLPKGGSRILRKNRLVRIIEPVRGMPKVKVRYNPKLDYARGTTKLKDGETLVAQNKVSQVHLMTNVPHSKILDEQYVEINQRKYLVIADDAREYSIKKCLGLFRSTRQYWQKWVGTLVTPDEHRKKIIRSALTLKLLTYSETGAIIAAATTSLPEQAGSKRNFDYRFCWVRDAAFCADAFKKIGREYEAKKLMEFIIDRCIEDDHIQPMYSVHGDTDLTEKSLPHLKGYKGSRPVRVGNKAYDQKQHDIYGSVIDIMYLYFAYYGFGKMQKKHWYVLKFLVNQIKFNWYQKDSSIWEFRGIHRNYVYSEFMCYVGVDRAIRIAQHYNREKHLDEWIVLRDKIKNRVLESYDPKLESFPMFHNGKMLDASLLLMAYHDFLEKNDPRLVNTIRTIYKKLRNGELVHRYIAKDDFGESTSAFTVCSFWLIDALEYIGEKEEAEDIFKKITEHANSLGLYSEDLDMNTKEMLGNFPQGYCHIAHINSSILLSEWSSKRKKIDWSRVHRNKWL